MTSSYFNLSAADKRDVIQVGGDTLGLPAVRVEKDIWVCWALNALFGLSDEQHLAFKGGTSLSKGYGAIDRFSEDLDVTVAHAFLVPALDPFTGGSKNRKRASAQLRASLHEWISEVVAPHLAMELAAVDPTASVVRASQEEVHILYPRVASGTGDDYVKEPVVLEFGGRNSVEPTEQKVVQADIEPAVSTVTFPQATVRLLSPERTFGEKATLIHVECQRPQEERGSARISRHWYDLFKLSQHQIGNRAVDNWELLRDVLMYKKVFYNSAYAAYDMCDNGGLRLVPDEDFMITLATDYRAMITAGMFMSPTPAKFDEIMAGLRDLEDTINEAASRHTTRH